MSDASPSIRFLEKDLIGTRPINFVLQLSGGPAGSDLALVIDIYDLDNPVHPEGHLGWWKFDIEGAVGRLEARLEQASASVNGGTPESSWSNADFVPGRGYVFNAVLRSRATNAILHLDRVPVMSNLRALQELRSAFDRNWSQPRFAAAHFLPGSGRSVHLVLPNLTLRDAVGNYALEVYRLLRQNGIPVNLYAARVDLPVNDLVDTPDAIAGRLRSDDRLLYFYSTNDPFLPGLVDLPVAKVAYFHGVTAPDKLRVFDPELSIACTKALAGLPILKGFERLAANSRHSADVLARALSLEDAEGISVMPPRLLPFSDGPLPARRSAHALLSVSQLNPHKRIEDVLRLFAACRAVDPQLTCWIVGRPRSRAYRDYLTWVEATELALPNGAVHWFGSIPEDELAELYQTAAAYVSMSEDEGFCLPLFDAMRCGLPVFAHSLPAVEETLDGAGVTFGEKDFPYLAEAVLTTLADEARLDMLIRRGQARAAQLAKRMDGGALLQLLWPTTSGRRSGAPAADVHLERGPHVLS